MASLNRTQSLRQYIDAAALILHNPRVSAAWTAALSFRRSRIPTARRQTTHLAVSPFPGT
jgi:hypothetical protein